MSDRAITDERRPPIDCFWAEVGDQLGTASFDTSIETIERYGANRLPGGDRAPAGVVYPRSTEDVCAIVAAAARHGVTLWPTSTGQNLGLGEYSPVRAGQVVVHLGARMNEIVTIDETLAFCVLEPGVTFRQLHDELSRRGDRLMISGTSGPPDGSVVGNALDKGAGYTPYFDHLGMTCGIEVVLADGRVLRTGDGAISGAQSTHISKYGFGPQLDGLFAQSNFGIVTRAGIWLMPRPPAIRAWGFTFENDDDLGHIIELVRPLKLNNLVPTLIKVTSGLYGLGTHVPCPPRPPGLALPDSERHALERDRGTGAWTVTGAFYGPSPNAIAPQMERIRAHFGTYPGMRALDHDEIAESPLFQIHLDTFSGRPTEDELGLLNWRGGGAIWFLPSTPMQGPTALDHQAMSRRILATHGFEYVVELVCGPRAARALHLILFDRSDEDECERARRCYRALMEAYDEAGYPAARMPTEFQEGAIDRMPMLRSICADMKQALDPTGVIAPGKYGIT
jgi:4-cresol dehydrogenase (hydroxylating) flavoprotein subunit